jgi:hypothetical protein
MGDNLKKGQRGHSGRQPTSMMILLLFLICMYYISMLAFMIAEVPIEPYGLFWMFKLSLVTRHMGFDEVGGMTLMREESIMRSGPVVREYGVFRT